jgi:hypothetical protein
MLTIAQSVMFSLPEVDDEVHTGIIAVLIGVKRGLILMADQGGQFF